MKKICNYRPIVLFCLSLILGISLSLHAKTSLAAKIILISIVSLIILSWVILFLIKKTRGWILKHSSKFIIALVAIIVATLTIFMQFVHINNKYVDKGTYITYARVSSMVKTNSYGKPTFEVDEVAIIIDGTKKELNKKAKVTLYSNTLDTALEVGDYVELKGTFVNIDNDLNNEIDINLAGNGIFYKIYVSEQNIIKIGKNKTLLNEKIQDKAWELLSGNMSRDNAAISFSMFFGDTAFVDSDTLKDFRDSGIAHLLAVSGLHLGFLVMLLNFIARKCKFNKYVEFAFVSIIMFLYALLCGFSSSVFRAFIMTIILLYSKLRYKEYDSLNSIALAAIIILLINPLKLWNAGFQLSFYAVLGIVLLAKPIEDVFGKVFNRKMASSLAVMLAVQIAITLPTMKFFNNFSILSLLTNIIAVPIANISFIVLFLSLIISLILPFMSFILVAAQYAIYPLIWLSNVVASIPFGVIKTKFETAMLLVGVSAIAINSDYIFIHKRYKVMSTLLCILLISCLFVF